LSAEFLGTFVILIFGIGVVANVVLFPEDDRGGYVAIGLGWGLRVAMAVYLAGGISGAHLNPAVTVALAVQRGFAWQKVPGYWIAQVAGAFVAAALMRWNYWEAFDRIDPGKTFKTQRVFSTNPNGVSVLGGLRDQVILTAVLVMLVLALIDAANNAPMANMAPLLIGLLVAAIGCSFGANSAWAINPARDLGPRLLEYVAGWRTAWREPGGQLYWWVPIIGPLVGGVLGAVVYDVFVGQFTSEKSAEPGRVPTAETASSVDSNT
jgi:glycerol uptake facilitator protein